LAIGQKDYADDIESAGATARSGLETEVSCGPGDLLALKAADGQFAVDIFAVIDGAGLDFNEDERFPERGDEVDLPRR
jgi:hypothetical protein